ncbi:uncharacterized protein LOC122790534 [Protopterus annectens]|uniref:uncharacterized protein LOC122790534 n=1 Tax=Protopterus annectens TaxID=7888 RepID=UPI001CFB740A|nr:uncharacterized protein LOC122790534 [Protopterus annectens]
MVQETVSNEAASNIIKGKLEELDKKAKKVKCENVHGFELLELLIKYNAKDIDMLLVECNELEVQLQLEVEYNRYKYKHQHIYQTTSVKPAITFSPKYLVYVLGEPVDLRCSVSLESGKFNLVYVFYRDEQRLYETRSTSNYCTYRLLIEASSEGYYSCSYAKHGSTFTLIPSNTQELFVTDAPKGPQISIEPKSQTYTTGQFITLVCSGPSAHFVKGYSFFENGNEICKEISSNNQCKYDLPGSDASTTTLTFTCIFKMEVWEWLIPSQKSEPLHLLVNRK